MFGSDNKGDKLIVAFGYYDEKGNYHFVYKGVLNEALTQLKTSAEESMNEIKNQKTIISNKINEFQTIIDDFKPIIEKIDPKLKLESENLANSLNQLLDSLNAKQSSFEQSINEQIESLNQNLINYVKMDSLPNFDDFAINDLITARLNEISNSINELSRKQLTNQKNFEIVGERLLKLENRRKKIEELQQQDLDHEEDTTKSKVMDL